MPTYVLPQVQVFQEFSVLPSAVARPLRAHVAGPHAHLIRYAQADERADGFLGFYDKLLDTDYAWPNRPTGGLVDQGYTKLWVKDALLQYFSTSIGGGDDVTKLSGYPNRVHSSVLSFKRNGTYLRSSDFLDRDVAVGDVAKVRGIDEDTGEPVTVWTYVKAVHGDLTAAVVGAATADADNKATQSLSAAVSQVAGVTTGVVVEADGASYDGLASGYITETYDLIVTQASVGGDYTTARLRVVSGSGTDDQTSVTPAAKGVDFAVGTRGLVCSITDDDLDASSEDAEEAGVPADELWPGQRFRVTVNQAFTKPTATSGGTYTGPADTTLIVEVTKGGLYADSPTVSVTTTNGIDISGPTEVTATNTFVDVGTYGVQLKWNQTALRKGDKYYVPLTAAAEGPMRQLELGSNLPAGVPAGDEVDLTLFIRKPLLQLTADRTGAAPLTNWEQGETEITVNSGITAYDPTWTDDGVPQALDLVSEASKEYGGLYVEYRAWLPDLAADVYSITDPGDLNEQISGALHPDNPLKWGVFKALENSNGVAVRYTAVAEPDEDESWADVLGLLVGRDDVYGLVPLTRRRTVLDLYAAHINDQSSAEQALWRTCWFSLAGVPEVPVVAAGSTVPNHTTATTTDGEVMLCVIEDDPGTSGTQYTILRCTSGNADFITNGVRAGDVVRTQYTGDGFGNYTYSEYVVDAVQSEDQLRLVAGPGAAVSVGAKTEVWRNLTATEEAAEVGLSAGSWGNRRVRAVWPDQIESAGTVMEGYHLCASLAALAGGVLPHQGLTNVALTGYSSAARSLRKFNRAQLDAMAVAGTWIVTQDPIVGTIYTRHAVTTGSYDDLNQREEMITRNVDSISYRFKEQFAPFIGVTNVTPGTIDKLRVEVTNLVQVLKTESQTVNLGGQLIDATLVELAQHVSLKDRVVLRLNLVVPYALNVLEVHLAI